VRRAIAVLLYPTLVLGAPLAALALRPHLGDALALGLPQLVVLAIVFTLERLIPFEPSWTRTRGELFVDVLHALISTTLVAALVQGLATDHLAAFALSIWPRSLPLAVQVLLALALGELGNYWLHRVEHEHPLLWRLHALHHAQPRVDALGVMRNHPLDVALTVALASFPAVLLGASAEVLFTLAALTSAHAPLQHANVELRLGPLRHVLNTAQIHRWHHARDPREANSNYAPMLLVWDRVFGTLRRFDARTEMPRVGLPDGAPEARMPERFLAHLAWPFRRDRPSG
jgi:ornithine lipid hydroxylase